MQAAARPMTYVRGQRQALPAMFLLLGVVYASWAARIPAIRDALGLDAAQLGIVLLAAGIGAVSSFPLAAWSVHRFGARAGSMASGVALLVALPCLALAPGMAWLLLAALAYGAASSCFDVGINALGAYAERLAGRSIMSMLHAWFCVGALAASLAGGGIAALGISPLVHYAGIALGMAVLLRLALQALPPDAPLARTPVDKLFAVPRGPVLALGLIGFCGAMAEGSVADWSAVFMKDVLRVGDGMAPMGFAGFAAFMLLARLSGDRLKDRFGARRVVSRGAVLAAAGVLLAVLAIDVPLTVAGFALVGAGLATVFPFVFSAAGKHGPTALAGVATLSYSGSLLGPPVIGFVAHGWGMRTGLAVLCVLSLGICLAAWRASWLE